METAEWMQQVSDMCNPALATVTVEGHGIIIRGRTHGPFVAVHYTNGAYTVQYRTADHTTATFTRLSLEQVLMLTADAMRGMGFASGGDHMYVLK